ncbi:hypothetical protein TBR22_A51510 [Luteitalea sp. TBR-22]|uniref:caspase family protein n=1 Tax=Luteitalea sp. TBR-22 TaxID=2802971 RepID=UPI001AF8967F|nr:caspase family protein [Luteitalea sp. TBR-22]BCS35916.1 hypothetical protein TBR22_A51510 [Luteitalea sp. TBR-22]
MAKRAFCVGINDYPYDGSDLNGCVNDATAWAATLKELYGFKDVTLLVDKDATRKAILEGIEKLLTGAKAGDVLVFTNSSHGSYKADTDGDEEKYDEILCPYDIADNDIADDDLRKLFANLATGVSLTVVLDNCFSGTATRAPVSEIIPGLRTPDDRRVRFLSPALRGGKVLQNPWKARPNRPGGYTEASMKEVLLTGCTDKEYSYDANIDGTYHGAMTYYALKAIREAPSTLTYNRLHSRITSLIGDYPQHPQLEGSNANKRRLLFT